MNLDRSQIAALKKLVRSDDWDLLIIAMGSYLDELNREEIVGDTEFQVIRAVFLKQGGMQHLKAFFDEIEKQNL